MPAVLFAVLLAAADIDARANDSDAGPAPSAVAPLNATSPVVAPSVVASPVVAPPVVAPPVVAPSVVASPVVAPSVVAPSVVAPPGVAPPVVAPPLVMPPLVTPPGVAPGPRASARPRAHEGEPERRLFPAQADLSAVGAIGGASMAGVALYGGFAYGAAPAGGGGAFFAGLGPEFTYAVSADPYRLSLGLQARAGYAFTADDGRPQAQSATPELFVYLRLSVFAAGTASLGPPPAMAPVNKNFAGVRLGLGLTSTVLLRRFFAFGLAREAPSAVRDALRVVTTLLLLPIVLLDHSEVMFEFADARPVVTAAIFRIGTGF